MKKKIFMSICTLFLVCFLFVDMVSADTIQATVPDVIPDEDDTLYAFLDEEFDFSNVHFGNVQGKDHMRKIILIATPNKPDELWFTVYCLDGDLKFPLFSLINTDIEEIYGATEDAKAENQVQTLLMMVVNSKVL